jgi:hypothetical protein
MAYLRGIDWDDGHYWPGSGVCQLVGVAGIVGAKVYSKTPSVRVFNPWEGVGRVFVRVGETAAALVGFDYLAQLEGVYLFPFAG